MTKKKTGNLPHWVIVLAVWLGLSAYAALALFVYFFQNPAGLPQAEQTASDVPDTTGALPGEHSQLTEIHWQYDSILKLWEELEQRALKCKRTPPTPSGNPGKEADYLAQLLGTKPATDPMIRCWGIWSQNWNRLLLEEKTRISERTPGSVHNQDEIFLSLCARCLEDLRLLWTEKSKVLDRTGGNPEAPRKRLTNELAKVRAFLIQNGRNPASFDHLLPAD